MTRRGADSVQQGAATLRIAPDHPGLDGHFPGRPVVPGVVIVDGVCQRLRDAFPDFVLAAIGQLKFLRPLLPGQTAHIAWTATQATAESVDVRIAVSLDGDAIARGNITLRRAEGAA